MNMMRPHTECVCMYVCCLPDHIDKCIIYAAKRTRKNLLLHKQIQIFVIWHTIYFLFSTEFGIIWSIDEEINVTANCVLNFYNRNK